MRYNKIRFCSCIFYKNGIKMVLRSFNGCKERSAIASSHSRLISCSPCCRPRHGSRCFSFSLNFICSSSMSDSRIFCISHFPEDLNELSFHKSILFFSLFLEGHYGFPCLAHTSATMFLTSFSTAVPFFVNVLSNVIVFRCFGLFAGVTILINYFLVVSFLPAFLILQRRLGRFIWLASLSIVVISAFIISFSDLHLPEYNPLQLFIASNPHEWFRISLFKIIDHYYARINYYTASVLYFQRSSPAYASLPHQWAWSYYLAGLLEYWNWLFATIFFLPLLSLTLPKRKDCAQCSRVHSIPMSNKF
uniref:SSD domain-containing protein n=1 Tax=Heterorhabditis bacteriophora TaxID=37862 RepID=A0A1I7WTZ3_HETBA